MLASGLADRRVPGGVLSASALDSLNMSRHRRYASSLALVAAVVIVLGADVVRSQPSRPDPLAPLEFLVGKWTSRSEGQPGEGTGEREYVRVLGSRFLHARNTATYPPQAKNPKGEKHEDMGFFSFDSARKKLVFRQFHVEGFVNTYVADLPSKPGAVVFTTEAIENIPPGWRARETYTLLASGEVEEVFELAGPGKEFEVYSRTRLTRVR